MTDNEALGLYYITLSLPKKSLIVEIGSWKGKSTYCIAKGLKSGKIYAIDPFNASGEEGSKEIYNEQKGTVDLFNQFYRNMLNNGVMENIVPLIGYSFKFKDTFDSIDFLFIDGDHSIDGCKADYLNFASKIKLGGYLAFHDYDPNREELGPTWVVHNLVLKSKDFKFHKQFDSLWVAKRI